MWGAKLLMGEHQVPVGDVSSGPRAPLMGTQLVCLQGAVSLITGRSLSPEQFPLSPSHWLFSSLAHQVLKAPKSLTKLKAPEHKLGIYSELRCLG